MMDYKFVLVTESKPNSFEPIYWSQDNFYNLKKIDEFTSSYSEEDFRDLLVDSLLLDEEDRDVPLQIIFNSNGVRRLKDGLLYKDELVDDMLLYIQDFVRDYKDDANLLNNLYQKINSDKIISPFTKGVFSSVFLSRHLEFESIKKMLNNLEESAYVDIRTIYLYIRRVLEEKINKEDSKNLILNKKSDELQL